MSRRLNNLLMKCINNSEYENNLQFAKALQAKFYQDKSVHNIRVQIDGLDSDMSYKYSFYKDAFKVLGIELSFQVKTNSMGKVFYLPYQFMDLRDHLNYTLKEAGELFGVTGQTYSKLENANKYKCRVKWITDKVEIHLYNFSKNEISYH